MKNETKQTAVQWLVDQLLNNKGMVVISTSTFYFNEDIVEQAKAMDKEQKKEMYFEASYYACSCYDHPTDEDFEEDYQKIYQDENSKD